MQADNALALESLEAMKEMILDAIKELADELTWTLDAYGPEA